MTQTAVEDEDAQDKALLTRFSRFDEFCAIQAKFLALDVEVPAPSHEEMHKESHLYYKLSNIVRLLKS